MPETIHAFVTDEGEHGFSMTSPQLPELVFGRPTEKDFYRDYVDAIKWAGFRDGKVLGHFQTRGVTPTGFEYLIRRETGESEVERLRVANGVQRLVNDPSESTDRLLSELQPSPTGELVFVACLANDTLGWLVDQLRPGGDVLIASLDVADSFVAMMQVATSEELNWPTLNDLGWDREMTLGALLARQGAGQTLSVSV